MDAYIVQQALAGRVFIGSTTSAGVDLPAENATAQTFGLWNPAGSGRNLVLDKFTFGDINATTPVIGTLCISYLPNAGASIATGAPISAFTETAAVSGLIGQSVPSHAGRFTLAATITAPTFFYPLGLSYSSTTPGTGLQNGIHDFKGALVVPPGVYIGFGSADAAQTVNAACALTWLEVDL